MDFKDVFGGPPKRYSMQERFSSESEEERSWSGLKEKRVFGDEEVRSRRRQVEGDDFFSDIFKGAGAAAAESSSYPSPTRRSSSFGSNPGSRIMSPLPPNLVDAFPSSLPPQFSLPVKVSKGVELPTFGSSPPLLSRFSSSHDDNDDDEMRHPQNNIFHFSIYKWAGTGSLPPIHLTPDFKKKSNDNNGMTNLFPMTTHHVDKPDTQLPVQPLNNSIHAFLNQPHHQEVKDKKPKTPTTGDDPKAETSPSLEKKKKNKKKSVKEFVQEERESAAPKDDKLQHKVDDNMNNHQPSQHSTNPNITLSSETLHTDSNISLENPDDPLDDNFLLEVQECQTTSTWNETS